MAVVVHVCGVGGFPAAPGWDDELIRQLLPLNNWSGCSCAPSPCKTRGVVKAGRAGGQPGTVQAHVHP